MIDIMIKSALLLAMVAVAERMLRRRTASLRHLLWSFAIVGTLAIPILSRVTPFHLAMLPSPEGAAPATNDRASRSHDPGATATPPVAVDDPNTPPLSGDSVADASTPVSGSGRAIPWLTVFAAVWALGAIILLTRLVIGLVTVQRIAGRAHEITDPAWRTAIDNAVLAVGVRLPVEVRFSDEGPMPFTCGLVRPIVVLPFSADAWSVERRDAVLLHELAHISRGDLPMNMLSYVMRALYWVNPLAWLATHRLRVEGERAADDTVLRAGAKASDYADHLLSIIKATTPIIPKVALAMARSSDFEGRLLAILEPGVPRARLGRARAAGLAAVFVVALMPLAAMTSSPAASTTMANAQDTPVTERASKLNTAPLPSASATIVALGDALGDASVAVRLAAVNSLGGLEDPAAIAALAKALKEDTDARVREAAAWALGEIDDNRAVPHLLEALKSERVTKVKEKIVDALAEIDDANALPGVSVALKDAAPEVRRAAVHALSEFEDPAAAPALIGLIKDDDIEVRRRVAEALGQLENSVAIDALTSMTRDADSDVRANAIESLHHFHDAKLTAVFVAALKDSSAHVRQHAAEALGNIENLKTAPRALIEALADANRDVRKEAAQALANIGDEAAVPALKKLVGDGDADTRRTAVEALKDIGGTEAIQALLGLLKDPDPEVRKIAAEALGKKR